MSSTGNRPQSQILLGQRVGRGVVVRLGLRAGSRGIPAAELRCDCGNPYVAPLIHLRAGDRQSCGCLRRERGRSNPVMTASVHGLADHELYHLWYEMVRRCNDPTFERYCGRGIRVCERWLDVRNFIADVEAEIGPRPAGKTASGKRPAYALDRTDNDGNYEPGNIRWATWREQRINQQRMRER